MLSMIVDATNIVRLEECYPSWLIPYKEANLNTKELQLDSALTFVEGDVLAIIMELCTKEDIGFNSDLDYEKILAIYSMIEYLTVFKENLDICEVEDVQLFIIELKEEFKFSCVRESVECKYGLGGMWDELQKLLGIPSDGTSALGLGYMTINNDDCNNIFTIHPIN